MRFRRFSTKVTVYHAICNDCGDSEGFVFDHGGIEARRGMDARPRMRPRPHRCHRVTLMANTPIILSARTLVEGLTLVDGFINPRHILASAIGSEPLEDGSQVTDHITNLPRQLSVTGIVSDFARWGPAPRRLRRTRSDP